jgi:hypothetical protein
VAILTEDFSGFPHFSPGKSMDGTSNDATTNSLHVLSNLLLLFHIGFCTIIINYDLV